MSRQTNIILITSFIIIACIVSLLLFVNLQNHKSIIPSSISSKLSFVVFWPDSENAQADINSVKYDDQSGVLSYLVRINNISTTVTEQATPSAIEDVPGYYQALMKKLNSYDTFGSKSGDVNLTTPNNTKGVTAVANQSGTLIFAHADGKVGENNWRIFFNNLKIIKN